ncbi:hypothetical protein PQQ96_13245 [Paraburkholderia sediminicola]|uniref:hypothetical protein n=1 Tax=Paraburkholderia sediminicola TaxID=458836 RepID=UPI0038B99B80
MSKSSASTNRPIFTSIEHEVIILYAVWDMIDEMVNFNMFEKFANPEGWYRHITLALLAHAVLAALRAQDKTAEGSLPFSVQEIRRPLCRLIWRTLHSIEHVMSLSMWRRRHQYRAQLRHYRRFGGVPPTYLQL